MTKQNLPQSNALVNKASLHQNTATEVFCQHCDEPLIFEMQDNHHVFSLGLTTVLECLAIAQNKGHIPTISDEWWIKVTQQHKHITTLLES